MITIRNQTGSRRSRNTKPPACMACRGLRVILEAGLRFSQWCVRVLSLAGLASYLPQPQEGAAISQPQLLLQRLWWQRGWRQQRSRWQRSLQQRSLQQRSRWQRSLQQRCLWQRPQLLSQPQLGALASQVGAMAAQVGAAQLGAAFAQLLQPLLQQRLRWWQQRSRWHRSRQQRSRWQRGAQPLSQPQAGAASQPQELPPPNKPAALTEEAIHSRPAAKAATMTRFIAILLKAEHTETETETTCRRNRRPRDVLVGAAGRDADVQRPSATMLNLGCAIVPPVFLP